MPRSPLALLPFILLIVAASVRAQTHPLPKTGELIDSAGFAAVVRAQAAGGAGKVTLSVTIDSAGQLLRVRRLETKLPEAVAAALADSLAPYMRPQAPWSDGRWWVRVAVEVGAQPRIRLQKPRITAPVLVDMPVATGPIPPSLADAAPGRAAAAYRVLVDADGSVLRFAPLASNVPDVTERLRSVADRIRYRAGTVDGVPERMWLEEHLRVRSVTRSVPIRR